MDIQKVKNILKISEIVLICHPELNTKHRIRKEMKFQDSEHLVQFDSNRENHYTNQM